MTNNLNSNTLGAHFLTRSQSALNRSFSKSPETLKFYDYASPLNHLAFSSHFFSALTFQQAKDMQYPVIAPQGAVTRQEFSDNVPRSASGTLIVPFEVLPNIQDLLPTTSEMEHAFSCGMRSVFVYFSMNGVEYSYNYHFSKIRLITLVNNHKLDVINAQALFDHLSSPGFELGAALEAFHRTPIRSHMKGFYISNTPLAHLGCLLSETWLHEDVFNTLAELIYFRHRALASKKPLQTTTSLFLPTSFVRDLHLLYARVPRIYSNEILNLRKLLESRRVKHLAMGVVHNGHFTAYIYTAGSSQLQFGDSLHNTPLSNFLQIFNWAFSDVIEASVSGILHGNIALQGGINGGEGSCALAALNFMESFVNQNLTRWSGSQSALFRKSALEDLIRYNYIAQQTDGAFLDWVHWDSSAAPSSTGSYLQDEAWGYRDFNLFTPKDIHPIYKIMHQTTLQHSVRPILRLPMVGDLRSTVALIQTSPPSQDSSDLFSKEGGLKRKYKPESSPILTSVILHPPKKHNFRSPSIISISSDSDLESNNATGLTFSQRIKSEPLDWSPSLPSTPKRHSTIDLCSPKEQKPTFLSPQNLKRETNEVIDLCTPLQRDLPTSNLKRQAITGSRSVEPVPGDVRTGIIFDTWEEAQAAVYAREERLGYRWRRAQGKQDRNGDRKKITLRCTHYYHTAATHSASIDPSDYRKSKTIKSDCTAHVNMNRVPNSILWHITLVDWNHNHSRDIPEGAPIRRRPTSQQRSEISRLATNLSQTFSRGQIAAVLKAQEKRTDPDLEPKQIGNIINEARRKAREDVDKLGGDFQAIIASLEQKQQEVHGWRFRIMVDKNGIVTGIWWQSPLQGDLSRRYSDILINDNTYNRNRFGYPLSVGIIIDGTGASRNCFYAMSVSEDIKTHTWIFQCHLESAGQPPETLISDRHRTLIAVSRITMPLTNHFYCIHHLDGNVDQKLRVSLRSDWNEFKHMFWTAYRAISPEEFDRLWNILVTRFPTAQQYLDEELYSCREQWAWAFTSFQFTCGVRTNGRCEGENRVNKAIGGPKKSAKQLFDGLNERTNGQSVQDMIRVRDSSRRQHAGPIESIFPGPLKLLRDHVGPFALQTCFKQMELSMFYQTEVLHRPEGTRTWNEYAVQVGTEIGYKWINGEEDRMMNRFENDTSYISTKYLLRLANGRGLDVQHLLRITHRGHGTTHILAILPNNNYVCDCCMGLNLGIPCRHYFQALSVVKHFDFDLGVVRARWYQDRNLDLSMILASRSHESQPARANLKTEPRLSPPTSLHGSLSVIPNPLCQAPPIPAPANSTQTLPARTIFHEAQTALRPLISAVQTQEQLEDLLESIQDLHSTQREAQLRGQLRDPPILNPKGRPRTQRLTGGVEGRPRGGGANIRPPISNIREGGRKCGVCRERGHNRANCPIVPR